MQCNSVYMMQDLRISHPWFCLYSLRALQILFSISCFYYILSVSLYSSIVKASLSPDLWLLAVAVCIMISGTVSWLRMTGSVETGDNEGNFSRHTHLTQWDPCCPAGRLQGDLFCFASRNASRSKLNSSEGSCAVCALCVIHVNVCAAQHRVIQNAVVHGGRRLLEHQPYTEDLSVKKIKENEDFVLVYWEKNLNVTLKKEHHKKKEEQKSIIRDNR